jgi:hypothetical protein
VNAPAVVKLIEQKAERFTLFLCQRCYDRRKRKNNYSKGWKTWNLETMEEVKEVMKIEVA